MKLKECFSSEAVNRGRQDELDMVKGFAIIFMVWDHVSRELGGNVDSPFGMFVDMILAGPFAAPMFMICMGVGICYSRNQDWQSLTKRGVSILFTGYMLNVFRYVLPQFVTALLTGDSSYMADWVLKLCEVDILQFAGLSFIVIGLARKFCLSNYLLTVIASVLSIAGCMLKDVNTGVTIPDMFLGLFWKTQEHAYFTFVSMLSMTIVSFVVLLIAAVAADYYQKWRKQKLWSDIR